MGEKSKTNNQHGFTMLELILVVTIIILLVLIVFVALFPAKRRAESRNAIRASETRTLLDALIEYQIDGNVSLPPEITSNLSMIGTANSGCDVSCGSETTQASCIDLSSYLVGDYVAHIPHDPWVGTTERTYYAVKHFGTDNIEVVSCAAELNQSVKSSR